MPGRLQASHHRPALSKFREAELRAGTSFGALSRYLLMAGMILHPAYIFALCGRVGFGLRGHGSRQNSIDPAMDFRVPIGESKTTSAIVRDTRIIDQLSGPQLGS